MPSLRLAGPQFRLLRYQFDSPAQLRRHCRLTAGRALLFFPDARPTPAPRSRALLEICFSGSRQQTSLPAVVHSHLSGSAPGSWLELRTLSVVPGLQSAVATPKRGPRRLSLDQLAWVSYAGGAELACPVLDIGQGGARLWGIPDLAPPLGEQLAMRLPEATTLLARIAWAHGHEVGVTFAPESLQAAGEIYARIEALWASARFAGHQPSCACAEGSHLLDPPSPMQLAGGSR